MRGMFTMTMAQEDDAGFRRPVPYVPVAHKRDRRRKRKFTVHVRPNSTPFVKR